MFESRITMEDRGHAASTGTYVWMIYYTDVFGHNQSLRGTLILVR